MGVGLGFRGEGLGLTDVMATEEAAIESAFATPAFRVQGLGCRVQGLGFGVQGFRIGVQGSGFRIRG